METRLLCEGGPTSSRLPITAVIPVRDETEALRRLLPRLARFARVIVVESALNGAVAAVASDYGAEFKVFAWPGGYPKKRTWAVRTSNIDTEWVLFLDADEEPTEEVLAEWESVLPSTRHSGFWLSYDLFFLGQRLRHGIPQRKLALVRRGCGEYERIEDPGWTDLDMEVHEHLVIDGTVGQMRSRLLHREEKTVQAYGRRHADYAAWEAQRYLALSHDPGLSEGRHLTRRQGLKYRVLMAWWFPAAYFVCQYFLRLGFLDGRRGLLYSTLKAGYFAQVQAAIIQARQLLRKCVKA
jgi:hypothetical protein